MRIVTDREYTLWQDLRRASNALLTGGRWDEGRFLVDPELRGDLMEAVDALDEFEDLDFP